MPKIVFSLIFSLLFAVLITFFPWEILRNNNQIFVDIQNYVYRIEATRQYGLTYFNVGETWIDYLKNEYLWILILSLIASSKLNPFLALKLISLFSAFVYHRFLSQGIGNVLAFIFLLNPITISLINSQVRSAFAFSLFLLALMIFKRPKLIYGTIPFLVFIHSAMFLIVVLYIVLQWFANHCRRTPQFKVFMVACGAIFVAIFVSKFIPPIMSLLEDRRNTLEYENSSILYVIFWLIWGGMLIEARRRKLTDDWKYLFAIMICVSVPVMTAMGFPGFRFLSMAFPLVMISLPKLGFWRQAFACLAWVYYQAILFDYWIIA